ncbi:LacI family DNA-binding transcriptional regulator [Ponticoccus sp. SC2-23]|uniref:LacI family DNA-binding transcriptional regulator n=1 Tax=Alexandriicola marinus TaxID=2081710 RepID=UPI000FD818B3|nr:LacI family DNA-binding transcriptional regulator [Alexandriicola marinus]MBM1219553.1 LacI family DNA-binding transcriptional regulator [Ponticoccus sp. SC6-9]MBM1223375.1 LacI family DNA-binding transcriptional regulator [Ponticoccus sp. SC6-15]MBM1229366.1 LacI family DNA-binding transcriptional regulator [Ponticoccus sp. SC6-38]MBM1232341.1 LacI family DNA-binding transcriptional regulator [Ponticoccus sp. SC6-45]MBM1237709.1 LacI family DNA-binding transcriptional regulator [Ponticoccu
MADGAVGATRRKRQGTSNGKTTLREVAEHAGVSPAAVSRAFTPGSPISDALRARVIEAAEGLGYRPNRMAAGLAGGRSGLVGIVADGFADPGLLDLLDHATRAMKGHGLIPILLNSEGQESFEDIQRIVHDYGIEALLLLSPGLSRRFVQGVQKSGIRYAHAFEAHSADPAAAQAGVRDILAARLAAATFAERGYVAPAMIAGPEGTRHFREPANGFTTTLDRLGLPNRVVHAESWSPDAGARAMAGLLAQGACDAVFCASDTLAIGALGAVRAAGRAVPEDIGLIGYDDLAASAWPEIDLSTIAFPRAEIARYCVDFLARLRDDPSLKPEAFVAEPLLVERSTLRSARV